MSHLFCKNCGVNIADEPNCPYCGAVNDRDAYYLPTIVETGRESIGDCSSCNTPLLHVDCEGITFFRCPTCYQKLILHATVKLLLQKLVSNVYGDYRKKLQRFSTENYAATDQRIKKCPVCSDLLHRKPYMKGSNIGVDECSRGDGIVLDNGQLGQILLWHKYGGEKRSKSLEDALEAHTYVVAGSASARNSRYVEDRLIRGLVVFVTVGALLFAVNRLSSKRVLSHLLPIYPKNSVVIPDVGAMKSGKVYKAVVRTGDSSEAVRVYYDSLIDSTLWTTVSKDASRYYFSNDSCWLAIVFPDEYYKKISYYFVRNPRGLDKLTELSRFAH